MQENVDVVKLALDLRVTSLLSTFFIILLGLLFGKLKYKGISFGSSGVLIIATFAGYFYNVPLIMEFQTLGIVLFMWAVGLEAGPNFFRAFKVKGKYFITMVIFLLTVSGITVISLTGLLGLQNEAGLGLFAGSFSSAPAFVSAMDVAENKNLVILGYGLAYPFGMIAVILFIQIMVNFYKERMMADNKESSQLYIAVYQLENEDYDKQMLRDIPLFRDNGVIISAILRDGDVFHPSGRSVILTGDLLRLEGDKEKVEHIGDTLGTVADQDLSFYSDLDTRTIVIQNIENINKTIRELNLRLEYGVTVTKVFRSGFEMPASADIALQYDDILTVVGTPKNLDRAQHFLGNKFRIVQPRVDITSLAAMLTFSFFLGGLVLPLPVIGQFSMGMTGGALIAGLLFGHFGKIGEFIGRFPYAATSVMKEFGLALFFVEVGLQTGQSFEKNIITGSLMALYILYSLLVALIPMIASFFFGIYAMKLRVSESFGVICGGMTFTPGLDIIRQVDSSEKPVVGYSSVYPVSLILIILVVQAADIILRMF